MGLLDFLGFGNKKNSIQEYKEKGVEYKDRQVNQVLH